MALLSPFPYPGRSCDFCKAAPAILLANGHLACERHKSSAIIELGPSSSSSPASSPNHEATASGTVVNDSDVDVWDPAAAAAAVSLPPTPPSNPLAHAGIGINSGSSSGARSASSAAGPHRKRRSPDSTPSVFVPPWGSPASPLAGSLETLTDDDDGDDDVVFTGTSVSSGVLDLTGASASAWGMMGFGGGGGSGSSMGVSHRRRRRSAPLPVPTPTEADIVDLAAAGAFFRERPPPSPHPRRRHSSLSGAGSGGGGQQHQPELEILDSAIGTAHNKRRAEGKQRAVVSVDKTVKAQATAVGAGAGAGAALSGSGEPAVVKSAQSAAKQGKKRQKRQPELECIVCFDHKPMDRCARCPEGHAMCKTCVKSYVTETLMPQGTIFWDRIKCGGSSTCGHLFGPSVTSLLARSIVKKIEIKQMDVAHLVAGERDPTSAKWISKHSKDCPNCGVPIQKSSGCMHMTCVVCRHDFWYDCDCKYPRHAGGCSRMY
ncbi:unnamed protein product [Pylaiella littoralis]